MERFMACTIYFCQTTIPLHGMFGSIMSSIYCWLIFSVAAERMRCCSQARMCARTQTSSASSMPSGPFLPSLVSLAEEVAFGLGGASSRGTSLRLFRHKRVVRPVDRLKPASRAAQRISDSSRPEHRHRSSPTLVPWHPFACNRCCP